MYELSEIESKCISVFKLLLIVLVVYVHSYTDNGVQISFSETHYLVQLEYFFSKCMGACAVPGFYLISSILLYRKPFGFVDNLRKKVRTILIPYLLLNSFWIVFFFVFQHTPLDVYFSNEENVVSRWGLLQWLDAYLGILDHYPILYPTYFLRDLFILNLIAPFFLWFTTRFRYAGIVYGIFWFFPINIMVGFVDIHVLGLWGIGCFLVNKQVLLRNAMRVPRFMLLMYVFLIVLDYFFKGTVLGVLFRQIDILLGISFLYMASEKIVLSRLSSYLLKITPFSFGIFLFHEMNLTIGKKICSKLSSQNYSVQFVEYLVLPLIIVLLCVIFCFFLKKYFPCVYGTVTGNRKF